MKDELKTPYFVLKPGAKGIHGEASRIAMAAYAAWIKDSHPKMSAELIEWAEREREALHEACDKQISELDNESQCS